MSFLFLSVIMFQLFQPAEAALGVGPSTGGPSTAAQSGPVPGRKYDESAAQAFRAQLEKSSSIVQECINQYLESLGWKFVVSNQAKEVTVRTGRPCDRQSIGDAKSHDDLLIEFPNPPSEADLENFFGKQSKILAGDGSRCGFQIRAWRATKTATAKLKANQKYQFSAGGKFCELPDDGWKPVPTQRACYIAKSTPSTAVECFYDDKCRTECAVGIQVGQLSLLYELYGKEQFDQEFQTNEIAVGNWYGVSESDNPFFGRKVKDKLRESQVAKLASFGPAMLVGNVGAVANVYGEQYLDSPNDRNENFMITNVSEEAARELAQGGLNRVNDVTEKIWSLNSSVLKLKDGIDDQKKKEVQGELDSLLKNPFLQGTTVYVHPLGASTLSYHISRLLKVNPRTPYQIMFYESNLSTDHFARHRKSFMASCREKLHTLRQHPKP